MRKNPQIKVQLSPHQKSRLWKHARKNGVPASRIVRRLIEAIPWDDPDAIQFVLSVDKQLTKNAAQLRAALLEAVDVIVAEVTGEAQRHPE